MKLKKVISGGQTGADQTGVEEAAYYGLETGGVMPKGFRTDIGPMPEWAKKYGLTEHFDLFYVPRTRLNVKNSDATLWFGTGTSPGFYCTKKACRDYGKTLYANPDAQTMRDIAVVYESINIAGNRLSKNPGVVKLVKDAFKELFAGLLVR